MREVSEQQAADLAAREQAMTDDEYHPDDTLERAFAHERAVGFAAAIKRVVEWHQHKGRDYGVLYGVGNRRLMVEHEDAADTIATFRPTGPNENEGDKE